MQYQTRALLNAIEQKRLDRKTGYIPQHVLKTVNAVNAAPTWEQKVALLVARTAYQFREDYERAGLCADLLDECAKRCVEQQTHKPYTRDCGYVVEE